MSKKYVITSIIPNTEFDYDLYDAFNVYCKKNNAELAIFQTAKNYKDDEHTELNTIVLEELKTHLKPLGMKFNGKISVFDLEMSIGVLDPLRGLDRVAASRGSLIVPFPRHRMRMVSRMLKESKAPRAMWCTGTLSYPNYKLNKSGLILKEYHTFGGIVLEINDDQTFNIRQLTWDGKGFYDLDKYYTKTEVTGGHRLEAMVLGDDHAVFANEHAVSETIKQIQTFKPKNVFHHDVLDSCSCSHHLINKTITKATLALTLEQEARITSNHLKRLIDSSVDAQHYLVASNHPEHLVRYLEEGRYVGDTFNHILALELCINYAQGKNPIEYLLNKYNKLSRFKVLTRKDSVKIKGIECACHGDKATGGRPGNPLECAQVYNGKVVTGHTHSSEITAINSHVVGTLTDLSLNYTDDSAGSRWCHSNVFIYKNGTMANVIIL